MRAISQKKPGRIIPFGCGMLIFGIPLLMWSTDSLYIWSSITIILGLVILTYGFIKQINDFEKLILIGISVLVLVVGCHQYWSAIAQGAKYLLIN